MMKPRPSELRLEHLLNFLARLLRAVHLANHVLHPHGNAEVRFEVRAIRRTAMARDHGVEGESERALERPRPLAQAAAGRVVDQVHVGIPGRE